ncbi:unknown [Coraliomargarita sp. CAG:312]|nr:unknown [Coraliomargarita sp. CAG:312]
MEIFIQSPSVNGCAGLLSYLGDVSTSTARLVLDRYIPSTELSSSLRSITGASANIE